MPPIDLSGLGGPSLSGSVKLEAVYATIAPEYSRVVGANLSAVNDMFMAVVKSNL